MDRKKVIRRVLKITGWIAGVAAGLVVLVVVLLLIRPVRNRILDFALDIANRSLPGEITAVTTNWKMPGRIEVEGVLWVDGADTLATAGRLAVSVDLPGLARKDVRLTDLTLTGAEADIPAITARFASEPTADEPPGAGNGRGYPRAGSLSPIPSLAVDRLRLTARRIRLTETSAIDNIVVRGGANLLYGGRPGVQLDELSLVETSTGAMIDSLWLAADLSTLTINGRGVIQFRTAPDIYLDCRTTADHRFDIRLSADPETGPPEAPGLSVRGVATLDGNRLRETSYDIRFLTPETGELARFDPVARQLAGLNRLDGVGGRITGRFVYDPAPDLTAVVDLYPNGWLDSVRVDVHYDGQSFAVDTLLLALPGLRLQASGTIPRDEGSTVAATVAVEGTQWLTNIVAGVSPPDSLSATIVVEADGYTGGNKTDIALRAGGYVNGFALDSLIAAAVVPPARDADSPYRVDLDAGAAGLRLIAGFDAWLPPSDRAIRVQFDEPPETSGDRTIFPAGRVQYDPVTRSINVTGLGLAGAVGDVTVNAQLDSLLQGSFDIAGGITSPPVILMAALAPDSATADSLRTLWRNDGPFELTASGRTGRRDSVLTFDATGQLRLPGPRDLLPLFSPGIPVDDMGPVSGAFSLATTTCDSAASYRLRLDLNETSWLDTAVVDVGLCGDSIQIDSALVAFDGLRIVAAGSRSARCWDMSAGVTLADSQLVRRLEAATGSRLNLALAANTRITGPTDDPLISGDVRGVLATPQVRVPVFDGQLVLQTDSIQTDLTLPDGFTTNWVVADSGRVAYTAGGGAGGLAGGDAILEIRGPELDVLIHASPLTGEETGVAADTFYAQLSGQDIASRKPFSIRRSPGGIFIESLELSGTIGHVRANGSVGPDSADLEARAVVTLPPKPKSIEMEDRLWPDTVTVDADFENTRTFAVRSVVTGVTLAAGEPVRAILEVVSDTLAARASLDIETPDQNLLSATASLPGYSIGAPLDGPIEANIRIDSLPVPTRPLDVGQEEAEVLGRLDGEIAVRGTAAEPVAAGVLEFVFEHGIDLGNYTLAIEGLYAGGPVTDSTLVRIRDTRFRTKLKTGDVPPGAAAQMVLDKSGQPAATVDFYYPLLFTLNPIRVAAREGGQMALRVRVDELAGNDFDPLLPPDTDLDGRLSFAFDAAGDVGNPSLDGSLQTQQFSFIKGRIARIAPDINLDFGGTLSRPSARGEISVRSGLLRLPEPKRSLHPKHGKTMLWEVTTTEGDTTAVQRKRMSEHSSVDQPRLPEMDVDIRVKIPESFRITGERLNLEMAGDLQVIQEGRRLSLIGELTPREGNLLFMGRNFDIRRGNVYFYGGDELNPTFDLTLAADVSSYRVEIMLTGTMEQPEIAMTSDPSLSESDIASLLMFGQPMSELNSSQSGLLQQRTAEILLVFGAAKLQAEMGERMGVDIVSVQSSTRKPDESALIVGKYINNKTLLKYEQNLDDPSAYLINLEYFLTKRIKLETFIDQLSNTGAEMNWTLDY